MNISFSKLLFILGAIFLGLNPSAMGQKETKIKLLGADEMIYDVDLFGKVRILDGNVRFKQNSTRMFCDSAVLFTENNSMKAYGNVRVHDKEKNLNMRGDSMVYNGDTKQGELRGNILLINEEQTLRTQSLDFSMNSNIAYYFGGGTIVNASDSSVLKSKLGYYHSNTEEFFFKNDVSYITDDYQIFADTMEYNTVQDIVYFHGPTEIYSDSSSIFCESGWYDKQQGFSTFSKHVVMNSSEQIMNADSVEYDQNSKQGNAYGNVDILDTANNLEILGDYARYNNDKRNSLVTGSLELIMQFTDDTLHLHSDTLYTNYDSTGEHRLIHAYHHVQFYKPDLQGKCDSLSYSEVDSTIRMYQFPIVWTDSNQITGQEIIIKTFDGQIKNMQINKDSYTVSEEEPGLYNQVKGKSLFAHFENNEINKIDVNRSGQTIYYVRDDSKELMGMNRLDCSNMSIHIDSTGINKIMFYNKPDGTFYPMNDLTPELKFLRHFYWRISERPLEQKDIFNWVEVPAAVRLRRVKK